MTNSFDIATEGLLQSGDGQCLKTVVRTETVVQATQATQNVIVARENGGVLVAAAIAAPVTVTPAPTETVSAERVDTQMIVVPGCSSSSAPGVSSYNDLTDVPTEFPPSAHDHEGRLFYPSGAYTFDVDATNADDGLTDPYKFVNVAAALDAIYALAAQIIPGANNDITLLLGPGDYKAIDFTNFFVRGVAGGAVAAFGKEGAFGTFPCHLYITAKLAPTAIANNEWTLIASAAVDAATRPAAYTANKALVEARFSAKIVHVTGDPYYDWLQFPQNSRLSGVAIINRVAAHYLYVSAPGFDAQHVALFGTVPLGLPFNRLDTSMAYKLNIENSDGAQLYVVHGGADMQCVSGGYPAGFKVTFVNPDFYSSTSQALDSAAPTYYVYAEFHFLGNLRFPTYGWLNISTVGYTYLYTAPASTMPPAGQIAFRFIDAQELGSPLPVYFELNTAPMACTISNARSAPIYVEGNLFTKCTSRTGPFITYTYWDGTRKSHELFGTGSPNGVMFGSPGDTYNNLSGGAGTALWTKESGVNTNTGWVATSVAGHTHTIANVTGLENRLFTPTTDFVFDIDSANADNGVTDPYKFVSALAAYAAIWELIPRLTIGGPNIITVLFGDGTYSLLDFNALFVSLGAAGDTAMTGAPIMLAQAKIIIKAKNYPDVIPAGAWSEVTGSYNPEAISTGVTNRALVTSAFNVVFYASDAEVAAAPWEHAALGIPANFVLDGVAFVFEKAYDASWNTPYFECWGAHGPGGYAVVNAYDWWDDDTQSPLNDAPTTYAADTAAYAPSFAWVPCLPVYYVHATARIPIKFNPAFAGAVDSYTLTIVNPMAGIKLVDSYSYYSGYGLRVVCKGKIGGYNKGLGWLHVLTDQPLELFFVAGSVCASGQTLLTFRSTKSPLVEKNNVIITAASALFSGVKLENNAYHPQKMYNAYSIIAGRFTGGVTGRFSYNHGVVLTQRAGSYSGTGSPEAAVYGYVGDTYQRTDGGAGTAFYVKETGNNTNTGWVAK